MPMQSSSIPTGKRSALTHSTVDLCKLAFQCKSMHISVKMVFPVHTWLLIPKKDKLSFFWKNIDAWRSAFRADGYTYKVSVTKYGTYKM